MTIADMMFAKLGYERYWGMISCPLYVNKHGVHIQLCPAEVEISKYKIIHGLGAKLYPFTKKEVRAIAELLNEYTEDGKWIYVKDRLPKDGETVEVILENSGGNVTTYEHTYDYLFFKDWMDGDGKFKRNTILWKDNCKE